MLQQLYYKFIEAPILIRFLGMALLVILASGLLIHLIEPETFPTVFEGVWWAVVTASTVGFGDYAPKTTPGRLVGMVLIFGGAGFLAAYFVNIAALAINAQNTLREGRTGYFNQNHLVIVGWNERSKEIIDQLKQMSVTRHIILIDDTLKENPYPEKVVHFIQGPPYKDDTLKRANLRGASIALITADQNANEVRADMNSILTLVAMKGFHPDLYCIVEILTKDQVINAERAGADEVIETNRHASLVMLNSIHFDRVSDTMAHLLNPLNDKHLTAIKLEDHWENKKFKQLSLLLLEKNILLVGVKRKEKTHINPSLDFVIEKGDELIVIMH